MIRKPGDLPVESVRGAGECATGAVSMIYLRCDGGRAVLVAAALGWSAFGSGCGDDDSSAAVTSGSGGGGAGETGGQGGAGAAGGGAGGQPPTGGRGGGGGADLIPSLCNPSLIDPFADFSGPMAVDEDANAFVGAYVLASDETVVRAYPAASVAPGMGATTGASFFVFPGGSSQLAAVAPDGANPGLVAIAGYGGDPLVQAFTVTAGSVETTGSLEPLVELVTDDLVSVTADDAGHLWVGIPDLDGQQLVVVARTPSPDCLAPAAFESLVTIPAGAPWCVVGVHGAAAMPSVAPTWGRHGGLLTVKAGAAPGTVEVERWSSPAGSTDPIAPTSATVEIGVDEPIGTEIFLGYQAIDLPDFDWTLVSYTGLDGTGEVLAIEGGMVVERFDMMGFFSAAPVPGGAHGRLLYTGQSELGTTDPTGQALYAADLCALSSD
jgi:hypothetical protein